jgi:hypothetical protein
MDDKELETLVEKGVHITHWINDGGCLDDKEEGYTVVVFGWNVHSFDTEAQAQEWLPVAKEHVLNTIKDIVKER